MNRGSRGRALVLHVEVREPGSLCGEPVDPGRRDGTALKADVTPAPVIDEQIDDVGPIGLGQSGTGPSETKAC